jgi:hypothetical protein
MFEQINAQWMTMGKRFTDTAIRAHGLAVEGFEKSLNINLKALEERVEATVGFVSEATAARDFETVKALFPKGLNLAKESAEKMVANGQEVMAVTMQTNESIGALMANDAQAAGETFQAQAKDVAAKVRKTAR